LSTAIKKKRTRSRSHHTKHGRGHTGYPVQASHLDPAARRKCGMDRGGKVRRSDLKPEMGVGDEKPSLASRGDVSEKHNPSIRTTKTKKGRGKKDLLFARLGIFRYLTPAHRLPRTPNQPPQSRI